MQQPLPPEESIKHFVVPEGFHVELFASEPDLGGKPISMTWDHRGRLWVCESYDYPNELQPPGQGRDRIRICEDTDGDGRADRFTVFAEDLSIPTAITHFRGGVIVQDGAETLFLKDTDSDDRADSRTTLLTGWNIRDTHGGVSNFRYGPDNWIWGMQGYNDSQPKAGEGEFQRFRMGFFRFKLDESDPPQVVELEFIRSTNNNTWGLGFSEEGLVFGSTANANPSIYMPIPNRYYERVKGWAPQMLSNMADSYLFHAPLSDNIRQVDVHGGYTAAAGHALYTARQYPQTWWNRTAFVCGPTGKLVGTFVIEPQGADFRSSTPVNLIASDDQWSAPIMAEVGPDGNVWIIDWYNFVVQHNPTPPGFQTGRGQAYESELRDKKHGRIYRVVYGDAHAKAPNLAASTPDQLVETLADPTMRWRLEAQRLLVERGETDVRPGLLALVGDTSTDAIGLNVAAMHALWTLAGLGLVESAQTDVWQAVTGALRHPSAGVRRAAVGILPASEESISLLLDADLVHDAEAQVRLAAWLALADAPPATRAADAAAAQVADVTTMSDRWLPDALTSVAAVNALPFLETLAQTGTIPYQPPGTTKTSPVRIVAEHIARNEPTSSDMDRLAKVLDSAPESVTRDLLAGLAAGWNATSATRLSIAAEDRLLRLIDRLPVASQGDLIRLARLLGSERFAPHAQRITQTLLATVADESQPVQQRVAAAGNIIQFSPYDDQVVSRLLELVTPQSPLELADGLIAALRKSLAPTLADQLLQAAPRMTPSIRQTAFGVLVARPETANALLDAMQDGLASATDLSLDQRQLLAAHPDRQLRRKATQILSRGDGLPNPDRQNVLASLMHVTRQSGDTTAGRKLFKKHCSACHTHTGEGTAVGPDLTGMAVHPKRDLLANILDPGRSVESNFRLYTVLTADGAVLSGMLATETLTSIELIDTKGKRHSLPREDITEIVASRKSLMPEGFEKQLTESELGNLLAFLGERQKFLPLPLNKSATTISTRGMFFSRDGAWERIVLEDWKPRTVEGVPFVLIDPLGDRVANLVMLSSTIGPLSSRLPRKVAIPCHSPAVALHLLGAVSGLGYPRSPEGTVSMIVRLRYSDGQTEDHELINGVHMADFMQHADVPKSELAFPVKRYQMRWLSIEPQRREVIETIELIKGDDNTAPMVMAITAETK